jgi:adrenodoxin-NADP+ reductase
MECAYLSFHFRPIAAHQFLVSGHPSYAHIGEIVANAIGNGDPCSIRDASVVVVGQGNVALDCARILAKAQPGLVDTDLASRALNVLGAGVSKVSVVGRRGHVQGAFTIKELRELVKLEDEGHETVFIVRQDELDLGATSASQQELQGPLGRPKSRIDSLLREAAKKGTRDLRLKYEAFNSGCQIHLFKLFSRFQV